MLRLLQLKTAYSAKIARKSGLERQRHKSKRPANVIVVIDAIPSAELFILTALVADEGSRLLYPTNSTTVQFLDQVQLDAFRYQMIQKLQIQVAVCYNTSSKVASKQNCSSVDHSLLTL